jgi:ketosteroid isomerase-like protein
MAPGNMTNSNPGAEIRQVQATIDRETAAIADGNRDAYFAVLTEDAVFMPPNTPAKTGAELRKWLDDFLRSISVRWLDFAHDETVVAGDLACHAFTCRWRVTPRSGGDSKVLRFKGLHLLRRGADGAWKIHREIWNTDP